MSTVPPEALARSLLLASRLFVREADQSLIEALRHADIVAVVERLVPGFGAWVCAPWTEAREIQTAAEYAGLFILPRPTSLSLRVGAWLAEDPQVVAARMRELLGSCATEGVPADHLAVVLGFAARLAEHEPSRSALPRYVERLLSPWVADFQRRLWEATEHPLYRAAASLLVHLVRVCAPPDRS